MLFPARSRQGLAFVCLLVSTTLHAAPPDSTSALDASALAARLDALVEQRWREAKAVPTQRTDDAAFLRRVTLDLIGRIPRVAELHTFLEDRSPDKRLRKIEQLLSSAEHAQHFATVWRDFLLPQANSPLALALAPQLEAWLRHRLRNQQPYDKLVRDLLTADPLGNQAPARGQANVERNVLAFYQANELKPENLAATTSRVFLGVKLECAQCHDHPFNHYSRDQFWELAAFFAGVSPFRNEGNRYIPPVFDPRVREIKIPGTNRKIGPRFLDGKQPKLAEQADPRSALVDWMVAADNPFFARAQVNHLWAHLFGTGLIDPLDEPSESNPPSHPALLDELARQLVLHQYDQRYLLRAITLSRTYQLSSRRTHPTQDDPRLFACNSPRGLSPEQLFDSLVLATGYRHSTSGMDAAQARFYGPQAEFRNRFANYADRPTETQTSILQALTLMNGKFIAEATSLEHSGTLAAVADSPFLSTEERLNALYLATLSRKMRPDESSRLVRYVESGGPSRKPAQALSDVFWVLLNSSEFLLNH